MVKTGARVGRLQELLEELGMRPARWAPPAPRLSALPPPAAERVLQTYHLLGGTSSTPVLRPGGWDLAFDGEVVVELDEELHFNRYRALTLSTLGGDDLPWAGEYRQLCASFEPACLRAATWGKRWSNPSSERLFGPAGDPGVLDGLGAPRWKQRALYDAMKDEAVGAGADYELVRLATHDVVGPATLDDVLRGRVTVDLGALEALVERRRR